MRIVFLGDSITGWSDLSRWLKFSHLVDCMIEARWGVGKATVLNRGIGGNTTADVLARLPEDVLNEKPDIVALLIGGNDAGQKTSKEETATNLDHIISGLKTVCPRVLLLQYHLLPYPDCPEKAWSHLNANNDVIAAAAVRNGCPLLNMAPIMRAAIDGAVCETEDHYERLTGWRGSRGFRVRDLVGPDGVHLNHGGELVYARAIFAKLRELNWLSETDE